MASKTNIEVDAEIIEPNTKNKKKTKTKKSGMSNIYREKLSAYLVKNPKFIRNLYIELAVFTVLFIGLVVYFGLMPITFHSAGFKVFLVFMTLIWAIPSIILMFANNKGRFKFNSVKWYHYISITISIVLAVVFIFLAIFTTPMFLAKNYRNLITISENGDFVTEIENYTDMKIPVVDNALAIKLGEKKLGEENYGSQYTITDYTMSYYKDDLVWIGVLEYDGFFKWTANKGEGAPGYVIISATNPDMQVEIVYDPIFYLPSAYFGQDLKRQFYFKNITLLLDERINFELDDEGNPMYVISVLKNEFAATAGRNAVGTLVLNAKSGEVDYFDIGDEPKWVDRVIPTEIANEQIDYWGKYKHGFFNTWFAKKELLSTSDGYNYIFHNGELCLYTGLTSIGKDESIVGIVICSLKTKETNFYKISGATEYAAKQSAEGLVQDLRYYATYPCLLNYEGKATYYMALKDKEGLIKKYAYVSVEDYTKVGMGDTIIDAQIDYNKKINITTEYETLTISEIYDVSVDGTTIYYIKFKEKGDTIYKANIKLNDNLPFLKTDDIIQVKLSNTVISVIIV